MSSDISNTKSVKSIVPQEQTQQTNMISMEMIDQLIDQQIIIIQKFQKAKEKLLSPEDIALIHGKKYIKKSGWTKIADAFRIDVVPVDVKKIDLPDGNYAVQVIAEGVWKLNGAVMRDVGIAEYAEVYNRQKDEKKNRFPATYHNIATLAFARAFNRTVSKLIGGGELSAEEIEPEVSMREIQPEENFRKETKEVPQQRPQQQGTETKTEGKATQSQKQYLRDLMKKQGILVDEDSLENMTFAEADRMIKQFRGD